MLVLFLVEAPHQTGFGATHMWQYVAFSWLSEPACPRQCTDTLSAEPEESASYMPAESHCWPRCYKLNSRYVYFGLHMGLRFSTSRNHRLLCLMHGSGYRLAVSRS